MPYTVRYFFLSQLSPNFMVLLNGFVAIKQKILIARFVYKGSQSYRAAKKQACCTVQTVSHTHETLQMTKDNKGG
jgi:hypothetical protein